MAIMWSTLRQLNISNEGLLKINYEIKTIMNWFWQLYTIEACTIVYRPISIMIN